MSLRCRTEDQEHFIVARWLDMRRILWCHTPNGGHRHVAVAAKLKRMGVKPGVPDFMIFDPPKNTVFVGVAMELKREKQGRLSASQKVWIGALTNRGWCAFVAHGATDAISQLEALGY